MLLDLISRRAAEAPASPALLAPGRGPLDYRGLYDQIRSAGAVLNQGGIGQAQRVALLLANGAEAATAFLAVSSHAIALPLDPGLGIEELGELLREMRVDALVAGAAPSPLADAQAAEFRVPLFRLTATPGAAAGCFTLRGNSTRRPTRGGGPSPSGADAVLLRTSGTTGPSKTVPLSHDNMMATAAKTIEMMALTPADRCLCLAPFFHKQGLVTGLTVPLAAGGSVIYPPAFEPAAFFAWMEEFRPSWYIAGPTVHEAILRQAPLHRDTIARRRLRFIRSGAAALSPVLMQALEHAFEAPVIEAYGMSEAGIACNPLPPRRRKPGKVGLPITELAIMGPADEPLGVGEIGEIAVRGASVTRGYDNSPSENAERFRRGWFYTGDEGRLDADGYLEVTGRRKEIVNRGGRKLDPREVEELLRRHPDVGDAAAFPIPHPSLGEDLAAAVVLKADAVTAPQELRAYLFQKAAGYKVPSRILVLEDIPRGATGKLERRRLAALLDGQLRTAFVAPRSALEAEIATIFAEVLQLAEVGAEDNFFALGGDSLRLLELILCLEKRLHRDIPDDIATWDLTPAALTAFTARRRIDADDMPAAADIETPIEGDRSPGPISPGASFETFQVIGGNSQGHRPPLFWCMQQGKEHAALSRALGADQPLYGMFSGFPAKRSDAWRRRLGEHYAAEIGRIRPEGPILLGGNCLGAYVAWQVVQELLARGRRVGVVFLMEATILRPYPGRVVLLYGRESLAYNPFLSGQDLRPEWQRLYGSYDVAELPGKHGAHFGPENLGVLASLLRHYLARETAGAG